MGEAERRRRLMEQGRIPIPIRNIGGQQQPFDISEAVPKQCVKCQGEHFDKAFRLGLISPMAARNLTQQEVRVEYQTYLCRACGHEFGQPVPSIVQ
jgi:hypothetical protein